MEPPPHRQIAGSRPLRQIRSLADAAEDRVAEHRDVTARVDRSARRARRANRRLRSPLPRARAPRTTTFLPSGTTIISSRLSRRSPKGPQRASKATVTARAPQDRLSPRRRSRLERKRRRTKRPRSPSAGAALVVAANPPARPAKAARAAEKTAGTVRKARATDPPARTVLPRGLTARHDPRQNVNGGSIIERSFRTGAGRQTGREPAYGNPACCRQGFPPIRLRRGRYA